MALDTSSLDDALAQLEKSVSYLNSEMARRDAGLREQFRAAADPRFREVIARQHVVMPAT